MPPLSSLRRRRHSVFALIGVAILSTQASALPRVVDGRFDDWPETDAPGNRILVDGTRVWIDMNHPGAPVNLQHLDAPLELVFKVSGQTVFESTLTFSPGTRGMGVALTTQDQVGQTINDSPYDLDVMFAPTIASNRFELVIDFSSLIKEPARCELTGLAGNEVFSLELIPSEVDDPDMASVVSIPACPADAIRIMSWNVRFGGLLEQPKRAGRILDALQPDIILLQELVDEQDPVDVATFLDEILGIEGGPWQVEASPVGSGLRTMVAARGVTSPGRTTIIRMQADDTRFVRAATLKVDLGKGRTLLACSIHLRCCGSAGSKEDQQRVAEARAIHDTLEQLLQESHCEDIILGGDLNLVGSRVPLQILGSRGDPSGADLEIARPLQLDGGNLATWADPSGNPASAFTPGRLDWLLYSGSSLEAAQAFVLDTADLDRQTLAEHLLKAEDASLLSDHFPVILDARKRTREP